MTKFIATSRTNPCPICGKTNGNCRTFPDNPNVLCMSFADAIGENINGYKGIAQTKDNLWCTFVPDDGSYDKNSESARQKAEEYQKYKEAQEKAKQEQFKGSLSLEERDKNIRAIIKHLPLSHEHQQELKGRGLSDEEIEKGKFATIKPFSELPDTISTGLAGVYIGQNGKPHIGSDFQQGILCPTINKDGLIVGYQVNRTHRKKDDGNKYVWACTGEKKDKDTKKVIRDKISSHLPNGELPINYHYCKDKQNQTLWYNDGNLKTYVAHCLHNIDIVGCAGGNFVASINQTLEINQKYKQHIYALDGGDILNRSVINRLKRLAETLKTHNIELNFAYWGQISKDGNDIDEIDKLEYQLLNIEQLLELAEKEQWKAKKRAKLEQFVNYHADITFNSRYVSDGMKGINTKGKITAIKANLNTGKTYWLYELLAEIAQETGQPVILIGSRQVLTCNSAKQLGITYCDKSVFPDDIQELFNSENELDKRLAIVADSLLKLQDIDWQNAIVIIDEAEQFLEHLLLAKTHINKVRAKVLALLASKLPTVERIILLDGHLSDFTCNYVQEISKLPLQKIENRYQENHRFLFGYNSKDNLISTLNYATEKGENNFIVGDSAKELTAMYHLDIERGVKAILLTRDNLADHKSLSRFLENNGKAILYEGIQNVYLSPVGQSGISIELDDYFSNVFGIFNGAIGTNTARQILVRERSNCDRHIWVNERGLGYTTDYDPEQIIAQQEFKEISIIESINYYQQLEGLGFEDAFDKVYQLKQNNKLCKDINSRARASLIAKNNIMKSDYSAILYDELKADGYQITMVNLLTAGNLEVIKEKKEELEVKQSQGVYVAPDIDEAQAEVLSNKDGLIESERNKLSKYRVKQYLPEFPLTSEFILEYIIKDKWEKVKSVNNYFLAVNPTVAERLDFNSVSYALWQSYQNAFYWANDTKQSKILSTIYKELNLADLISKGTINEDDTNQLIKSCKKHRRELRLFGIKFNDKTYKSVLLNKILKLFGHKATLISKKKEPKKWEVKPFATIFDDIYQSISLKYSQEIEINYDAIHLLFSSTPKTISQYGVDGVPKPLDDLNISHGFGTNYKPYTSSNVTTPEKSSCHILTIDSELQINEDDYSQAINEDLTTINSDSYLAHLLNTYSKDYLLSMSDKEFIDRCEEWMSEHGLTDLEFNQLLEMKMNNYYAQSSEAVQKSSSENEFKFAPTQIDSENIGKKFKRWSDHLKTCIIKAFYEFQGRFYCDVIWENSNEFEQHLPFSFLEPIT